MSVSPGVRLLEMEFRRHPTWVMITVPTIAVGSAMISGTTLVPRQLIAGIQAVFGPGMASDHIFAGLTLLLLIPVFRLFRVPARDLGLGRRTIGPAVLATLALWLVAIVLVELLSNLWAGHRPGLHSVWFESGAVHLWSVFLGATLGAGMEEVVFRAVLFPQVYVRLADRFTRRWVAIATAILVTQGGFALLHVPYRLQTGYYDAIWIALADQALLIGAGCLGILVLVATRNLGMLIGLHALYNAPVPLFAPPPDTMRLGSRISVLLFALAALTLWTWFLARRRGRPASPATASVAVGVPEPRVIGG